MSSKFDLILWGATGYTGELCAVYLAENYATDISWAIAARSSEKLEKVKENLIKINPKLRDLAILTADSLDKKSMEELASKTSVILTTVGPYAKFGTPLIEACIKQGTHYCDITGENGWTREMIDRFQTEAKEKKICIVPACGFDSIPSDIGVFYMLDYLAKNFRDDTCLGLKAAVDSKFTFKGVSGGSAQSLVHMLDLPADKRKESQLYNILNEDFDRTVQTKVDKRDADQMFPTYNKDLQVWTLPFFMEAANTRVVRRTQSLMNAKKSDDPLHKKYFDLHYTESLISQTSAFGTFVVWFIIFMMMLLLSFQFMRKIATKYLLPASGTGLTEQERRGKSFTFWFIAKMASGTTVLGSYRGREMYEETAKVLVESGMCLIKKQNLGILASEGGFLTPATCMGPALIERLQKAGSTLTIEKILKNGSIAEGVL